MKNKILKLLAVMNGASLIISFGYIEEYVWIPFFICLLNMAYLTMFGYANGVIE